MERIYTAKKFKKKQFSLSEKLHQTYPTALNVTQSKAIS